MSDAKALTFFSFIDRARGILRSKTGQDTQTVFAGQVIAAAFGFAVNVLLLRNLEPENYGLFSLFNSTFMFLAGIFHFGWMETFVRYGARYLDDPIFKAIRAHAFFKILTLSLILFAVAAAFGPWVTRIVYGRPDFTPYYYAAALGALATCLFSFFQNDYRIRQNFSRYFSLQVGSAAMRLLLCGAALLLIALKGQEQELMSLFQAAGIYVIVPVLFALVAGIDPKSGPLFSKRSPPLESELRDEMSAYNRWILLSILSGHLIGNLDTQILAHYQNNRTLSAFGAASRLCLPIQFVISSLTITLLPKLSAAKDRDQLKVYFKKILFFLIPLVLLLAAAIAVAPPLLVQIAGDQYNDIQSLIRMQMITMLITLIANPISLVLFAWGYSKKMALLNFTQLWIALGLNFLWIPTQGAMGAIRATLVVNLVGLVYVCTAVASGFRKEHR